MPGNLCHKLMSNIGHLVSVLQRLLPLDISVSVGRAYRILLECDDYADLQTTLKA